MRLGDRVHLASDPTTEGRVVRILDAWHVRVYWLAHPTHGRRWTRECVEALGRATPGRFALNDVQVNAQSGVSASAEVALSDEGTVKSGRASGNGTLDAVFRAIQQVTGVPAELEDFSLAAATQGSDALGEAVVTLSQGSRVVVGRAAALDVVEAAANAYVNALNWLVRPQAAPIVPSPSGGVIQGSAH